ncbi:hypothetical protein SLEP1_g15879 [Rubroshorea leprosula]|uniref:Uncharacterized protein n=1 Tax=Rubroshorea leprosula TaxID=152421 RepID=A0AAV5IUN2_9ROSI|nr:hypothetical protein SLEP1_g15879 [Rubroshorea leprosula]
MLSYQIIAVLVSNSRILSQLKFIHRPCSSMVNLIANLICLISTLVFEKFYEKSLSALGFALSITVLFLILLVIIRPSTDLGLFGFLIGVIGSVAYNLFGLNSQTWIVVAICFPLVGFRIWLDKMWLLVSFRIRSCLGEIWLEVEEDREVESLLTDRSTDRSTGVIIEELTVAGFHLFWLYILFRANCPVRLQSISCTPSSVIGTPASLLRSCTPGPGLLIFCGSGLLVLHPKFCSF